MRPRQEPTVAATDAPDHQARSRAPELWAGERIVVPSVAPEDEATGRPGVWRAGLIILVVAAALMGGAGLVRAFVGL